MWSKLAVRQAAGGAQRADGEQGQRWLDTGCKSAREGRRFAASSPLHNHRVAAMASGAEPVLSQAEVDAAFAAASQEIAKRLAAASAAAAPLPAPAPAADELAGLDDILDLDAALNALDVSASAEAAAAAPAEQPKAASAVSAEVQEKIIAQVEFYFSDENLPTDEFLLSRVKQNKQGWGTLHHHNDSAPHRLPLRSGTYCTVCLGCYHKKIFLTDLRIRLFAQCTLA